MKNIIVSILFSVLFYSSLIAHVGHYNKFSYLEYKLFRNNKPIGYHKYEFDRKDDILTIKSLVEFKISKLNIDLYKYYAKSTEIYKKNQFYSFSSETNQNKKEKYVKITVDTDKKILNIDGSSYKGPANIENIVGTWWNHEIIKSKSQISAISGRIIEQSVTFVGKEKLNMNGKEYNALRFNFKSSDESLPDSKKLNTDVWYEENSYLWLKAAFDKTGYWEYRLTEVR